MSDILNLIEEIKGKGKQMNDNLGSYAQMNGVFRNQLKDKLQSINALIQQLNLADVGKNRVALEQANKDLEETRKQLNEKQDELQRTRESLTQAQQELATANQETQSLNDQMKALQEESDKKMNELTQQHAEELEKISQENATQMSESQNASQAEKNRVNAECEQKIKDAQDAHNAEKQQIQEQVANERANIEQQMNDAQRAREDAEQKLAALENSQAQIQQGLSEINQLIEAQLALIQKVIASEPSNDDLSAVVEAINMNLSQAMKMLNQTQQESQEVLNPLQQQQSQSQQPQQIYTFEKSDNPLQFNNQYSMLSAQQKNALFPSNSARLKFDDMLRQASQTNNAQVLQTLASQYNAKVEEYKRKNNITTGGRRKRHIVTKHTVKRTHRMSRLSGKPPGSWNPNVLNPTKPCRKTKKARRQRQRQQKQKGGYMYKDDASLRSRSVVVEDKKTSRTSSRYTKKSSRRPSSKRLTRKRS
jgi:hypothetical protein